LQLQFPLRKQLRLASSKKSGKTYIDTGQAEQKNALPDFL